MFRFSVLAAVLLLLVTVTRTDGAFAGKVIDRREARCAYLSIRLEGGGDCTVALGQKEIVHTPFLKYCLSSGRWRIVVKCPRGRLDRTLRLKAGEHVKWIVRATDLDARRVPSR